MIQLDSWNQQQCSVSKPGTTSVSKDKHSSMAVTSYQTSAVILTKGLFTASQSASYICMTELEDGIAIHITTGKSTR